MQFSEMIDASSTAAVLSDPRQPDNPIVACNSAFLDLTGYARSEVIGRNCRFLSGKDTEADLTEALRSAIRARRPAMVEILNYRKDGSPFRNAVMVAPIFDALGEIEYFLGSQVEVALAPLSNAGGRHQNALDKVLGLTRRQREILRLMAAGKRNKQIAHGLGITERTIKMHRQALLAALRVPTSADAIRLAVEAGF